MILEVVRHTVHLGNGDIEIFLVGPHLILEEGYRYRLAKQERVVRIAAPMDSSVKAVAERNVVCKLMQFAIHRKLAGTEIRIKAQTITGRNNGIGNLCITVQKELENSYASASDSSMPGRIRRVCGRSLRERLREQVAAVADIAEIERG